MATMIAVIIAMKQPLYVVNIAHFSHHKLVYTAIYSERQLIGKFRDVTILCNIGIALITIGEDLISPKGTLWFNIMVLTLGV